jgi:hypothetical protein
MSLALRLASTTVMGWRVFGPAEARGPSPGDRPGLAVRAVSEAPSAGASRARAIVAGLPGLALPSAAAPPPAPARAPRSVVIPALAGGGAVRPLQTGRARGIGSRFASRATVKKEA